MLHTLSAIEIRDRFLKGEESAVSIVSYFLDRIEKLDPKVKSFLAVLKDKALEKARLLDQKKKERKPLGKLAGIPIAIKDNIHIENELSTCGSKFLSNYKAPFNATVIDLLEKEDAIFIGKTNMDEFAMGSSNENSAFNKTFNPWNLECTPGGSSGGSAAAVAARLCPLSLGSDTGGSIRLPASFCGIVGFKPTYGRISRFGLVAYGSSLDQIGPFATNTEDAALLMEVLGKHCEKDSTSIPRKEEDYLNQINKPIQGMKIGVPWQFLEQLSEEPKKVFKDSLKKLEDQGAIIVDVDLSLLKYALPTYYILATAEASTNLARFDGIRYGVRSSRATTLDEVYEYSKTEGFGDEVKRRILLGTFVLSSGYQDAYYKKAQKVRTLLIESYKEAFKKCDVIATPVSPSTAFKLGSVKDPIEMYLEDIYTIGINLAGLPAISVPAGFSKDNMPIGLQIIGAQEHDVQVLQVAKAFENSTNAYNQIPELFK